VFEVDAVFHRRDAIYPATVVGKPRQDRLLHRRLLAAVVVAAVSIGYAWSARLMDLTARQGSILCARRLCGNRYGREALVSAFRILGEGQLSLTKFPIAYRHAAEPARFSATVGARARRFNPQTDLFIISNVSMDTLDYTSGKVNEGSKAIMLGVGEAKRELPREFRGSCLLVYRLRKILWRLSGCAGKIVRRRS